MQDSLPAGGLRLYREGVEPSGSRREVSGHITVLLSRACPDARIVYSKPPFGGPEAVLAYLSRTTHRVAIANRRLIGMDEDGVTFRTKDYRRDGDARHRTMTLPADEFIRRFLMHVLPKGFHRIRHCGLLATGRCKANIARARELLAAPAPPRAPKPASSAERRASCPCCGGRMLVIESFGGVARARAPPPHRWRAG